MISPALQGGVIIGYDSSLNIVYEFIRLILFQQEKVKMIQDRREFIKTLSRGLIVSGLAVISGVLIFRDKNGKNDQCNFDFVCKNCKKINSCTLPEASDYKKMNLSNSPE